MNTSSPSPPNLESTVTPPSKTMSTYRELEASLREVRSTSPKNNSLKDLILETMSDLWWNLSEEEREVLSNEDPTCSFMMDTERLVLAPYYPNEQQRMLSVGVECNVVLSTPAMLSFETPEARIYRFQSPVDLVAVLSRLIMKKELPSSFDKQARSLLSSLGYPLAQAPKPHDHAEIVRLGGVETPAEDRVLVVGKKYNPLESPACLVFEDSRVRVYIFQTTHALRKALTNIWIANKQGPFSVQVWDILHLLEDPPSARNVLCQADITNGWVRVGKGCPQPPSFFDTLVVEETDSWVFQFSDKTRMLRALNTWIREKHLPVAFENQARDLLARLQKADMMLRPNWTTPVDPEVQSRALDEFRKPGGEGRKMADDTAKELQADWDSRIIEGRKQKINLGIRSWFQKHPCDPLVGTTALYDFIGYEFSIAEVDQALEAYRNELGVMKPSKTEQSPSLHVVAVPTEKDGDSRRIVIDSPILQYENEAVRFRRESSTAKVSFVPATFHDAIEDGEYDCLPSPETVDDEDAVLIRMGAKFTYAIGDDLGGMKPMAKGRYTSTFLFRNLTEARAALEDLSRDPVVHYDEQEEICRALRTLRMRIRYAHPPTNDAEERT